EWSAFYQLNDESEAIVREIIEKTERDMKAGTAKAGTNAFKVGAYFDACMDTTAIEALGTKPIEASMARIARISSAAELPAALAELEHSDGLAPFGVSGGPDLKNSNRLIANAGQGGLTLPERNYYLSADSSMRKFRDSLVAHIARTFQLYGENAADA